MREEPPASVSIPPNRRRTVALSRRRISAQPRTRHGTQDQEGNQPPRDLPSPDMVQKGGSGGKQKEDQIQSLRLQLGQSGKRCQVQDKQPRTADSHAGQDGDAEGRKHMDKQHEPIPLRTAYGCRIPE